MDGWMDGCIHACMHACILTHIFSVKTFFQIKTCKKYFTNFGKVHSRNMHNIFTLTRVKNSPNIANPAPLEKLPVLWSCT